MDGGAPSTLELRWRWLCALNAAAGPLLMAGATVAFWLWVQAGGADDLGGGRTLRWVDLLRQPPGSWLWLAAGAFISGMALLLATAPLRRLPSLRLDADGVTAWTELRLRRATWEDVTSIGLQRLATGPIVLEFRLRNRPSIRLHGVGFDEPLVSVLDLAVTWLEEHRPGTVPVIGLDPNEVRERS